MSKAQTLVEQLLGEAEVNRTGAPPPPPGPGDHRPSTLHSRPLSDDDDDDDEDDAEPQSDPEATFESDLHDAIANGIENAKVRTFDDVGVMTRNKGLVVTTPYGSFQVSIVKAR